MGVLWCWKHPAQALCYSGGGGVPIKQAFSTVPIYAAAHRPLAVVCQFHDLPLLLLLPLLGCTVHTCTTQRSLRCCTCTCTAHGQQPVQQLSGVANSGGLHCVEWLTLHTAHFVTGLTMAATWCTWQCGVAGRCHAAGEWGAPVCSRVSMPLECGVGPRRPACMPSPLAVPPVPPRPQRAHAAEREGVA